MDVSIHCAAIDADGDGEITVEELEAVLIRNGMADHEKVADIVKEIDTNNVSNPELDKCFVKCFALYPIHPLNDVLHCPNESRLVCSLSKIQSVLWLVFYEGENPLSFPMCRTAKLTTRSSS